MRQLPAWSSGPSAATSLGWHRPPLHSHHSSSPRVLMANLVLKANLVMLVLKAMLVPPALLDPLAPLAPL